jgi:hypothetical protein
MELPAGLRERVAKEFERAPTWSWDRVVFDLVNRWQRGRGHSAAADRGAARHLHWLEKAQREQKPAPTPRSGSMEWFEMMKNRQPALRRYHDRRSRWHDLQGNAAACTAYAGLIRGSQPMPSVFFITHPDVGRQRPFDPAPPGELAFLKFRSARIS